MRCVICNKSIKGDGNNALPVKIGRCCNACYFNYVFPAKRNRYGVLIPTKGKARPYEVKSIGSLDEIVCLQEAVGGFVKSIKTNADENEYLLTNERGADYGEPINRVATYLVHNQLSEGEYIAGDALMVMGDGEGIKYFTYDSAKVKAELINNMAGMFFE